MITVYAWAYGNGLAFTPRVRVMAWYVHPLLGHDMALCKVTGRNAAHKAHYFKPGDDIEVRASTLYKSVRTLRGTFGRLEYYNRADYKCTPQMVLA